MKWTTQIKWMDHRATAMPLRQARKGGGCTESEERGGNRIILYLFNISVIS